MLKPAGNWINVSKQSKFLRLSMKNSRATGRVRSLLPMKNWLKFIAAYIWVNIDKIWFLFDTYDIIL